LLIEQVRQQVKRITGQDVPVEPLQEALSQWVNEEDE